MLQILNYLKWKTLKKNLDNPPPPRKKKNKKKNS